MVKKQKPSKNAPIGTLAKDLPNEFPGIEGLSSHNILE